MALSLIADYLISISLSKSKNYSTGEISVWNDIYEGNVNSDMLIYGSSRAWLHIDPELIEKELNKSVYNLGIDGHGFFVQNLRHKELQKHNKQPKFIILSLDIGGLMENKGLFNMEQFLPFMLWNKNMIDFTSKYDGYSYWDYRIPCIRYAGRSLAVRVAVETALGNEETPLRKKGYMGRNQKWNSDLANAKKKKKHHVVEIDSASLDLFDEFLLECQLNETKVILVYTPEYIEGQKFVINRKEVMGLYRKYAKKYNIPFLDYSNDEMCLNRNYFYNSSHLNKFGSSLFTKKLTQDLKICMFSDNY